MRTRVALYARFSSDLQSPTSAADQLSALKDQIRRRHQDWDVVREERDEGVSGTSRHGRDGLKRLLIEATRRPRPFDVVVVEDLSRLSRNRGDSIAIRDEFSACGVTVLSAADGFIDPDSEAGFFVNGIKEMKAEADSRETGRRVRRGVKARTLQGWVSGRKTPFGYRRQRVDSAAEETSMATRCASAADSSRTLPPLPSWLSFSSAMPRASACIESRTSLTTRRVPTAP